MKTMTAIVRFDYFDECDGRFRKTDVEHIEFSTVDGLMDEIESRRKKADQKVRRMEYVIIEVVE